MTERPRVFYRGTNPSYSGPRIATGDATWDACLFLSSEHGRAAAYGRVIDVYEASPGTRILYEGTREYRSVTKGLFRPGTRMLPSLSETVRRAANEGYAAVWFKRQGDFGTAVVTPDAFRLVRREYPQECRVVGGQPVEAVILFGEPPLAREIFARLAAAGLPKAAIFGGCVRDADCSVAWREEVPIKDYDVRVWIEDASPSGTRDAVVRLEAALGVQSRIEPSLGTGRPRHAFDFAGAELDVSFRTAPMAPGADAPEAVAIDRALDSDAALSSVALDPAMRAWARPEYAGDRDHRTLSFFPIADPDREAAYVARMSAKFPELSVRHIERFPDLSEEAEEAAVPSLSR